MYPTLNHHGQPRIIGFETRTAFRHFQLQCAIGSSRKLFVNPQLLASLSPVFERLIGDRGHWNEELMLRMEDEKFEHLLLLFQTIMPTEGSICTGITGDNSGLLLYLADKYTIVPLLNALDTAFSTGEHCLYNFATTALQTAIRLDFSIAAVKNLIVHVARQATMDQLITMSHGNTIPKDMLGACFSLRGVKITRSKKTGKYYIGQFEGKSDLEEFFKCYPVKFDTK